MRAPHRRGRVCVRVRASVSVCVYGSALYVSWGKCGCDPLPQSSRLPRTNKQTNNNMEPSGLHFQDKRPTLARKVCSLWIMRFPPKNTSTPKQTHAVHLIKNWWNFRDVLLISFLSLSYFTLYCIFLCSTNYTYFGYKICHLKIWPL